MDHLRKFISFVLFKFVLFSFFSMAQAKEFPIGNIGFKDYDGYYYFLDLENLTPDYLGLFVDFYDIRFSFSLTNFNYHFDYEIYLSDDNQDNIYDPLTGLYFSSFYNDINTYYDGENISSLSGKESLLDLIYDAYNSALLMDPYLYIGNIYVSFSFDLDNFLYEDNGVTYIYSGTINYENAFLMDGFYEISSLSSWSVSLKVDIEGSPLNTQPIPEPSSLILVVSGIGAVFAFRQYWAGKEG